jgi:endonuclease/exonuclease/phosphatase family metal-dependent hydrolase
MFQWLPLLLLIPIVACSSCGSWRVGPPERPPISPRDEVRLSDSPYLAHLARSLEVDTLNAGDLFTADFQFTSAPDPSPLLRNLARKKPPQDLVNRANLRILSYNVALYDPAWYMEFYDSASPYLDARRRILGEHVFKDAHDIVFVQEVMRADDVARFEQSAKAHGYTSYVSPRSKYNDRLMLFVRNDLLRESIDITAEAIPFHDSVGVEYFPGPKVWRGYQRFSFTHPRFGRMHLYNTHMSAYAKNWRLRMEQARQLSLDMAEHAGENGISILGGDVNSAPYYKLDQWILPNDKVLPDRWKDAMPYAILLHYGRLVDLFVAGKQGKKSVLDVETSKMVRNVPERAKEIPGGTPCFCENLKPEVITATDCNSLYFQSYGGESYPARLDHLVACDPQKRIYVLKSGLAFTDKVRLDDETTAELSDHYGVWVELALSPQNMR